MTEVEGYVPAVLLVGAIGLVSCGISVKTLQALRGNFLELGGK